MKNLVKKSIVAVAVFSVVFGLNTTLSAFAGQIAVVDIQTVVSKSAQVQALKKEQEAKMKELQSWLDKVKTEISKQKNDDDKQKLVKKYDAEFAKKQQTIKENYAKKIQAIDKSISDTIAREAQLKGYDIVVSKGAVLYGGKDITADITKIVK